MLDVQQRRIIFRADASSRTGGGHVMRCLTLAECFKGAGWLIGVACSSETLAIFPHLRDRAEVLEVADGASIDGPMLGRYWPSGCDVLVVDHYALDARFELGCRGWAAKIVAIDDLANRTHDCDLLIDTTPGRLIGDYAGLVPTTALVLTGPGHALLRSEFATHREQSLRRRASLGRAERIFVGMGLTDVGGITKQIVKRLLMLDAVTSIDAVVGESANSRASLQELSAREPRLRLHVGPSNIANLMANADIAVGAGGTGSWERCCMGLPTVLLVLAENQRLMAMGLERTGASVTASQDSKADDVAAKVLTLIADPTRMREMIVAAACMVDGRGSERVQTAINRLLASSGRSEIDVRVRPAAIEDSSLIWTWRNDPATRAASRNRDIVAWNDHEQWFARKLADVDCTMLVGILDGVPIGIVRFERLAESKYEVNINVAPASRNSGLGTKVLSVACVPPSSTPQQGKVLLAQIKPENQASRRVFGKHVNLVL